MSFDIFIFDHTNAPRDAPKFLNWYERLTDWGHDIDYNNPDNASDALRSWLNDMVQHFPPLNGPLAAIDTEESNLTDYSIGREFIYSAFPWSSSESARELALQFAAKHSVGFFDTSAEPALVLFPDGYRFNAADALKSKPWWRFW